MAMLAGTTNPHVTHFASIMSNYSFQPHIHKGYPDKEWKKLGYKINKRELPNNFQKFKEFKLPYTFLEDQIQYDALEGLKISTKPKLFFLGLQDEIVNLHHIKKAYESSSSPKQLHKLNSPHDYRFMPEIISEINQKIAKFLNQYKL
jgi:hypothetical protein